MTRSRTIRCRPHISASAVVALAALFGCSKEAATAPPPAPGVSPPDAAVASPATPAARSQLDVAKLESLLARWLEAQNRGDYAAYEALYASKFMGIKRAGVRTTRFERSGWLKDRARMFKKPMQVAADGARFEGSQDGAQIEFTQRFASGNFADEGNKRLLVVRERGELRIAHEEMLSSHELAGADAKPDPNLDLYFLLKLERGLFAVLESTELRSDAEVILEQEVDGDQAVWTTSRALALDAVPATSRALKGQRLRLDTGCSAEAGEFVLLSRVDPHFATEQSWNNAFEDQPAGALSLPQQAAAAFELGERSIAVQLRGCAEGSFAQRATTPPPVTAQPIDDPGLSRRARAAFAKLPEVMEEQKMFLTDVEGAKGTWWSPSLQVEAYRHPGSGQILISAHAYWMGDACADYSAKQWAFFELRDKALVLLAVKPMAAEVESVLDLNADGRLELIVGPTWFGTQRELVSPDPDGPGAVLSFDYQDCPC
ncbi:MAG TPA: hypothetical protein VFZ61_11680 [Polyangiales bacterium]